EEIGFVAASAMWRNSFFGSFRGRGVRSGRILFGSLCGEPALPRARFGTVRPALFHRLSRPRRGFAYSRTYQKIRWAELGLLPTSFDGAEEAFANIGGQVAALVILEDLHRF